MKYFQQQNALLIRFNSLKGEHDNLLENRRKTEIVATLLKLNPTIRVEISDTYVPHISLSMEFDVSFLVW